MPGDAPVDEQRLATYWWLRRALEQLDQDEEYVLVTDPNPWRDD